MAQQTPRSYANGSFKILDSTSDRYIYMTAKDGIPDTEVKVLQVTPSYARISLGSNNILTSGSFGLYLNDIIIENINWDHDTNLTIILRIVEVWRNAGFQDGHCSYDSNSVLFYFDSNDQILNNGHRLAIVPVSGDLDYTLDFNFNDSPHFSRSYLNNGSWCYAKGWGENLYLEKDGLGNVSSCGYSYTPFPFFNSSIMQVGNNDLSQDGGSNFTDSFIYMFGASIKGYSYINAPDCIGFISNLTLDKGAILDLTSTNDRGVYPDGLFVSGTIIGNNVIFGPFGGDWTTFYLTENFNGYINLQEGRSTLRKTFEILDGYRIDADYTQDLHWTGEIHLNYSGHGMPPTIWEISNIQFLPDYFKIVVNPGEIFTFGAGNWAYSNEIVNAYGDPLTVGAGYNGGELCFWREKYANGSYTGNILCTSVITDYYYN